MPEMDVKPMGKEQGFALGHLGLQVVFVERGLDMVLGKDLDHLGLGRGVGCGQRLEAVLQRQLVVGSPGHFGNHHLHPAVPEVEGLGVALGTEADDGDLFPLENLQIRVCIIVHFHDWGSFL